MNIIEIKAQEKQRWNDFVVANKGELLQSWEWGDFQSAAGKKIWRLAAIGGDGKIGKIALIIRHDLPFGKNYLYCPRGPVPKSGTGNKEPRIISPKSILDKIKEIAKKEKSVFLRVEPDKEIDKNFLADAGMDIKPADNLQPKDTLILDLTKSEEQLLAEMKQKTRYNIRLAEKRGVKARISDEKNLAEDFEKFWSLVGETARRDKFQSHPKGYYQKMLSNFSSAGLFIAEYESEILAANIVIFFGERAVYLHGASSSEKRDLMAPYLLQWEQIKTARRSGCKEYDFWGIDPRGEKSWKGITRFKKGFGGMETNYPRSADFIFQPTVYEAIRLAKKIKGLF